MKRLEKIMKIYALDFGVLPMISAEYLISCSAKRALPEHAKSIICILFPYYSKRLKGDIAKYAMVADYHIIVKNILMQICAKLQNQFGETYAFVPFVDHSPIPEVFAAASSGLGVVGKNGLLIHPTYGSYVFIGEIVTDYDFHTEFKKIKTCLHCGKCVSACPNAALYQKFDRQKCLSEVTQSKKPIAERHQKIMKRYRLLWGCDICQDVCPMNQDIAATPLQAFSENIISEFSYDEIEQLTKERAFGFRGSKVVQRNYKIIHNKT